MIVAGYEWKLILRPFRVKVADCSAEIVGHSSQRPESNEGMFLHVSNQMKMGILYKFAVRCDNPVRFWQVVIEKIEYSI